MISMELVQIIVACLFMGLGLVFLLGSLVGMLRLPDFYSRIHASGNSETLGTMLVFLGLAVYNGFNVTSAKIIVIFLFVFIGNPIGSHILSKCAYKTGHSVWTLRWQAEQDAKKEAESDADLHD